MCVNVMEIKCVRERERERERVGGRFCEREVRLKRERGSFCVFFQCFLMRKSRLGEQRMGKKLVKK